MPLSDHAVGEVDPEADDEDTEEEIEALVTEVEKALADMPPLADSSVVELAATMLLKVRGFIAKGYVRKPMTFTSENTCHGMTNMLRSAAHLKQRNSSKNAVLKKPSKLSNSYPIAKHAGAHGMV